MKFKEIYLNIGEKKAGIYYHKFNDIEVKTFLIEFENKVRVLSTLEGLKEVNFVGNNYTPEELWDYVEDHNEEYKQEIYKQLNINSENSALLFTGVDMDNIAIREEKFENLRVIACVTAGVKTNAQRIGVDEAQSIELGNGKFRKIEKTTGTVNIIVIPNVQLTDAAMARAIITITEAKTIAFEDLKIRSSYNKNLQATGTGTDNVIVVSNKTDENKNKIYHYTGGHSKLGEIIAKAVTYAVKEAIAKNVIDYYYKNG
ncbi:MAG: adenosylcobinamide amidohydrolase [Candidatus Altarchaeaceae archaeon]